MKATFCFLLATACFLGCAEEEIVDTTGTAQAYKNGELWVSQVRISQNNPYLPIGINFGVVDINGELIEGMFIFRVKANSDYQRIHLVNINIDSDSTGVWYTTSIGNDALGDIYEWTSISEPENFIQFTNIDLVNEEVSGIFNVSLKIERDDGDGPPPPPIIRFTEGTFTSKIKREWFE